MIYKEQRYLGNTNTLELHDTANEHASCELDEISYSHRRWYETLAAANADRPYDGCHWCLGGSRR